MFRIENGRENFWQWDLNQRLIIDDVTVDEVHFCNKTDISSLVCEVYEDNGVRVVDVPNILLRDNWDIRAYAYCSCYTLTEKYFKVKPRTMPADYVYTETQVKRWEDLEKRVSEGIGFYQPSIDTEGNLSWTANNPAFPAVEPVNIKGDKGDTGAQGAQGIQGLKGDTGNSGVYLGTTMPTDPNISVWIDTSGDDEGLTARIEALEKAVEELQKKLAAIEVS